MLNDIIKIMKSQHREMESILVGIDKNLESHTCLNERFIVEELAKFKEVLKNHVKLEDMEFYPELLEKIKIVKASRGAEVEKIIEKIDQILVYTYNFLSRYDTEEKIHNNISRESFIIEFVRMSTKIEIRISVEEVSVYQLWEDIKSI